MWNISTWHMWPCQASSGIVSCPDPTRTRRGSGDIWVIPRTSITLITFCREISLCQSHCRKHNLQCNTKRKSLPTSAQWHSTFLQCKLVQLPVSNYAYSKFLMKLKELTGCHQALSSRRLICRKKMSHVSLHSSLSKLELKNLSKLLSGRKEAGNSHSRVTSSQVFNYWVYSSVQPLKTVSENELQGWDSNLMWESCWNDTNHTLQRWCCMTFLLHKYM